MRMSPLLAGEREHDWEGWVADELGASSNARPEAARGLQMLYFTAFAVYAVFHSVCSVRPKKDCRQARVLASLLGKGTKNVTTTQKKKSQLTESTKTPKATSQHNKKSHPSALPADYY